MHVSTSLLLVALTAALGGNYKVSTKGPGKLFVGSAATVRVDVKPADGWHMNLQFPTSLTLTSSDGLTVAQAKLKAADAKTLDEQHLVFVVPVTALTEGSHTLTGKLKFAVCRAEACAPVTESISARIVVQPAG